ncbi:MAG TPA: glycosyltransferase [Candidatus Bathyarchaeia archaeon]|nr:glycosyltransferase [Candidatus Bathyarchaeia archaeon]
MGDSTKISVIIPAYNAEKTIEACVDAVLRQKGDFELLEVIVVDDGSTDATAQKIKTFNRVSYIFQVNAGPAAARNRGAATARGDLFFFTDADCIPEPDWLQKMMVYFKDPDVKVVAGSYGIQNPESLLARCIHQEIRFRHRHLMGDWIEVFGSYNVGFRRPVFEKVSGFDETYRTASGEDNDLSYRLRKAGYAIRFAKDALVAHRHPVSVKRYLLEQFRHGYWRAKMYKTHPGRLVGDGYTFWKDMLELALVAMVMVLFLLIALGALAWSGIFALLVIWFLGEAFFAAWFAVGGFIAVMFYGVVMLLRSWARSMGFLQGFLSGSMNRTL